MSDVASSFGGGTAQPDPLLRFLQRVVPWSVADPPDSFVNVHAFGGTGRRPYRGGGQSFGGPAGMWEAVDFVRYLNRIEAEVFFCLSAQSDYNRERSAEKRVAFRRGIKACLLKSFGLDLDVKPGAYPSQRAALAAVLPFLDGLGLKPGPIVSSGAGVHVWVTLDQPIPPDRWRPLAAKLAAAAKAAGLHFDQSCTVNQAGLWRMPSSTHRKDPNNPREVKVLGWGEDMTFAAVEAALAGITTGGYAAAAPRAGVDLSFLPPRPPINGPDAERVRAELERARETTSFDLLRSVCGVVADSEERGGDGDIEPLWFELGKLMRFVQDGRAWFHRLSEDDARYDEEQTDAKFDSVTSQGWPRCATIEASSPAAAAICQRCPYFKLNLTPIHHARGGTGPINGQVNGHAHAFANGSDITYQFPPPGYTQTPESHLLTPDGHLCFANPVLSIEIRDRVDGDAYVREIEFEVDRGASDGPRTHKFPVPYEAMTTAQEFRRACLKHGLTPLEPALKVLMPDLLTMIHNQRRVRTQQRMGWVEIDGVVEGFSFGGQVHGPQGPRPTSASHSFYKPRGSLEEWQKAANVFVGHGLVEMETIIATAFAAPLMRYTVVDGVVVFVRSSQSGEGKSASLETGASVWMSKQGMLTDGTMNATLANISQLNNLPLFFDEFIKDTSDQTARQAAKAILSISAGKQPARLNRNLKLIPQLPSRTMMVGSSNISLVELAKNSDTNAQAARVLEIELSNVVQRLGISFSQAATLKDAQERNFGTAGLVYAAALGKHHEVFAGWVASKVDELQKIIGHRDEERFWISAAATILVGARAAKALGLLAFDTVAMQKFLVDVILRQRGAMTDRGTNADDPDVQLQRVANFLNDNLRGRIITAVMPSRGRGRTPVMNPMQLAHSNGFVARCAKEENVLWVSEHKLQEWFRRNNMSYGQARAVLERREYCVRSRNKRKLGGNCGHEYTTSPEIVLEFDLTKPCNANLNPPDDETGETDGV